MGFEYPRTIRFHETDAAGVVYFANVLILCHEAYEASLASVGIDLQLFFGQSRTAVPVVHAEVDFRRPLHCGDQVIILMVPRQVGVDTFEIDFHLRGVIPSQSRLATAMTRHVCIDTTTRQRYPLTPALLTWLETYRETPLN